MNSVVMNKIRCLGGYICKIFNYSFYLLLLIVVFESIDVGNLKNMTLEESEKAKNIAFIFFMFVGIGLNVLKVMDSKKDKV